LHEQTLETFSGKLDFKVRQFEQQSGAHGYGDKKQLQLYPKHYPATMQTQLCILGTIFYVSITLFFYLIYAVSFPIDFYIDFYESEIIELDFDEFI
jgi:hypothetical protein